MMRVIHFNGGPKDGLTINISHRQPLADMLVFQGMFDGEFQVHEYTRVSNTNHYSYKGRTK